MGLSSKRLAAERSNLDAMLFAFSLIYLGTPNVIFAIGSLKPFYTVMYTTACILGVMHFAIRLKENGSYPKAYFSTAELNFKLFLPIFGAAVTWGVFSGIGGIGFQNDDWYCHNSLLKLLIEEALPLILHTPDQQTYFYVYYIAYYLPAALIGKFLGWGAANIFLFIWSVVGLIISMAWFLRILEFNDLLYPSWLAIPIFIAFSGLDYVGWYYGHGQFPELGQHIEWWANYFQYSGNTTLLFWVPQHSIAAWILIGVVMFHEVSGSPPHSIGLYVAFTLLWTPFAIIGIIPFLFMLLYKWIKKHGIKEVCSISNLLLAPLIAFTSAIYLASNTFSFPISFSPLRSLSFFSIYLAFIFLEVAVFMIPIYLLSKNRNDKESYHSWLWTSAIILIFLPFFQIGFANDLVMRGSIPAIYVLAIFVCRQLLDTVPRNIVTFMAKIILLVVLGFGGLTSLSEVTRSVKHYQFPPPSAKMVPDFKEMRKRDLLQRQGDPSSFFYKFIAKK